MSPIRLASVRRRVSIAKQVRSSRVAGGTDVPVGGRVSEREHPLTAAEFVAVAHAGIDRLMATQLANIEAAADIFARVVRADGVIHAFGTGHSEAAAMEICGRAGGLVNTNKVAMRDLVFVGGVDPAGADPMLERDPASGRNLFEITPTRPADAFVVISNSGGNGSVVEFTQAVRDAGLPVIAITSLAHTTGITSRHPSGKRLFELADVVIDNGAPYGDAVLDLPAGGKAAGISSVTSAVIAQLILIETLNRSLAAGEDPPVYLSANIPGADDHNSVLEDRYAGRIRRGPF